MDPVIGVLGGSGGVGASTFAAALAAAAGSATLIDADPVGGGVDVLLGIETMPGARWSGVHLDGGHLDPVLLAQGLPRWGRVVVLAADIAPEPAAVLQVIDSAVQLGPVVLDLGRRPDPEVAARCALCVVVALADVRELAAARAVLALLGEQPCGLVLRRGALPAADARALLGIALLGVLGDAHRVAAGVWDGLAA